MAQEENFDYRQVHMHGVGFWKDVLCPMFGCTLIGGLASLIVR